MPVNKESQFQDVQRPLSDALSTKGDAFPVHPTEELQNTTSTIAKLADALLRDTPVTQGTVHTIKQNIQTLTLTYDEEAKKSLITPLWPKLEESYTHATNSLEDYGYQTYLPYLPTAVELHTSLLQLSPLHLAVIAKMRNPRVLVTTPGKFTEKIARIDNYHQYSEQCSTRFSPNTPSLWDTTTSSLSIAIIDEQPVRFSFEENLLYRTWGERREHIKEEFHRKKLPLLSPNTYTHFIVERLSSYSRAKQNSLPNPESLMNSLKNTTILSLPHASTDTIGVCTWSEDNGAHPSFVQDQSSTCYYSPSTHALVPVWEIPF